VSRWLWQVAVPVPLPRLFDYLPAAGHEQADPAALAGCRVRVPFGRRELVGVVCGGQSRATAASLDAATKPPALKPALALLDGEPLLTGELWRSLRWAAAYYHHPLGEVLHAALPALLRRGGQVPALTRPGVALSAAGSEALEQARLRPGPGRDVLGALKAGPMPVADLVAQIGEPARAAARRLLRRDWLQSLELPPARNLTPAIAGPPLNPDQRIACEHLAALLQADAYAGVLLDGVTGSGKTEVYLTAIAQVLAAGRQALVLVPEIALTPQALRRYRQRLGATVLALHSGLSDGERARVWAQADSGQPCVVLGTRSAIFTPLPRAGLIVVDEEHDSSYKQGDGFRYHARDLALVRGKALAVPVLLGSATPSLESLALVDEQRLQRLILPRRTGQARPPQQRLIDLRGQRPALAGLASAALTALTQTLARGEQALVFRNRRGYAPMLACAACGWHAQCPRCDRAMTLHRRLHALLCHHCGHRRREPDACPDCQHPDLLTRGIGTERIHAELQEHFPQVPVLRIDRDSVGSGAQLDAAVADIDRGEPAILVGTQLLAKGHDWPALTLVIVADADSGLFSADFRAPEAMAQLLTQVAGRAGRGDRPGTVLVQTRQPQHGFWLRWLAGGHAAVAAEELAQRRNTGLPPFSQQALLAAEAADLEHLDAFFKAVLALPQAQSTQVERLGPLPAPMPRRAGHHRAQVLLEAARRPPLHALLDTWIPAIHGLRQARRVRWSLDVDPYDLY